MREDPGPIHVHGLGINPADGALFKVTVAGEDVDDAAVRGAIREAGYETAAAPGRQAG